MKGKRVNEERGEERENMEEWEENWWGQEKGRSVERETYTIKKQDLLVWLKKRAKPAEGTSPGGHGYEIILDE